MSQVISIDQFWGKKNQNYSDLMWTKGKTADMSIYEGISYDTQWLTLSSKAEYLSVSDLNISDGGILSCALLAAWKTNHWKTFVYKSDVQLSNRDTKDNFIPYKFLTKLLFLPWQQGRWR